METRLDERETRIFGFDTLTRFLRESLRFFARGRVRRGDEAIHVRVVVVHHLATTWEDRRRRRPREKSAGRREQALARAFIADHG